ncbi:hypothetical protein Taro_019400, partial [Colocasia esculenta]|nr:hypothetical protein [Colocasia esculenta]
MLQLRMLEGPHELRVELEEYVCEREKRELGAWVPRTLLSLSAQTHSPMALMALTLAQMALEALQPDQLALLALPLLVLLLLL